MANPRAFIAAALLLLLALAGPAAAATKETCDNTEAVKYCGAKATKFPCSITPTPYVKCVPVCMTVTRCASIGS